MKMKTSKSFLKGYSRALDLGRVTKEWPDLSNNKSKDYRALRGDWDNVGSAIRRESRNLRPAGH